MVKDSLNDGLAGLRRGPKKGKMSVSGHAKTHKARETHCAYCQVAPPCHLWQPLMSERWQGAETKTLWRLLWAVSELRGGLLLLYH